MLRMLIGSMLALAASGAVAQQMEPGEWEFTNTVTSAMLPQPQPQTMTMRRCITRDDVSDPARWQGKPESDCKMTPKGKSGDRHAWEMTCPKSGMRGSGTVRYGKGTVVSETKVVSSAQGQPFEMLTKMKGRRVGPCKS
jgi:hypothetical protein